MTTKPIHADPYPLRDRVRPFFRGLVSASPLVEVALEGLKRDLPDDSRRKYVSRIAGAGSTRHIFRAFLWGLRPSEQDLLGEAFEAKYHAAKLGYDRDIYESESALGAPAVWEMKKRYMAEALGDAVMLLREGHVASEKAEMAFASLIWADGMRESASELLEGGRVRSMFARHILGFKSSGHAGFEA